MIEDIINTLLADNSSGQITPQRVRYISHQLLQRARTTPFGELQRFKGLGNTNQLAWEVGDIGSGFLADGSFVPFGYYLGGDITLAISWNSSNILPYTQQL